MAISKEAVQEMIRLIDLDRDGKIAWREFHHFLCNEVALGKDVLGSQYVLPSGLTLPLGPMILKLRRKRMMMAIAQVREA